MILKSVNISWYPLPISLPQSHYILDSIERNMTMTHTSKLRFHPWERYDNNISKNIKIFDLVNDDERGYGKTLKIDKIKIRWSLPTHTVRLF